MIMLSDGRAELYQWDTGREVVSSEPCNQFHFTNKVYGRTVDVDAVENKAKIPDFLLQSDADLTAYAFVGSDLDGYTKVEKIFKVVKRNKPADYVFTPTEQTTIDEIRKIAENSQAVASNIPKVVNGNWWVYDPVSGEYKDTGIYAGGDAPHIGVNGNWFVGAVDTGVAAQGPGLKVDTKEDAGGVKLTITDYRGPHEAYLYNGKDGKNGKDGQNGVNGQDGSPGKDGTDGQPGADGKDGVSPTVAIQRVDGGAKITVQDATSRSEALIQDGVPGKDGKEGPAGKDGAPGKDGKDGTQVDDTQASATAPWSGKKANEELAQLSLEKVDIPATGDVGQSLVVKSVDPSTGKPTGFECKDFGPSFSQEGYEYIAEYTTTVDDELADVIVLTADKFPGIRNKLQVIWAINYTGIVGGAYLTINFGLNRYSTTPDALNKEEGGVTGIMDATTGVAFYGWGYGNTRLPLTTRDTVYGSLPGYQVDAAFKPYDSIRIGGVKFKRGTTIKIAGRLTGSV